MDSTCTNKHRDQLVDITLSRSGPVLALWTLPAGLAHACHHLRDLATSSRQHDDHASLPACSITPPHSPQHISLTCRVTSSVLRTAHPRKAQATRPRSCHTTTRHIANRGLYSSSSLAYLDGHAYSVWFHPCPNTGPRGLIDPQVPLTADWLLFAVPSSSKYSPTILVFQTSSLLTSI